MSNEVVELCQRMVRIPSVNPQDSTDPAEPYGEARMASFVFDWLGEHGLSPQRQTVQPERENVLAMAEGADSSKTLLLTSHMDTVDVKDMTVEPFAASLRQGRIYGRGACDDKGPLAAMMIAFRDRVRQGKLPYNLMFLASCGEEYNMAGANYFTEHLPEKLAGAVFGEPSSLKVVIAHKGVVRLQLETQGRSAHSSRPETGKNAIYPMARAITVVEEFIEGLARAGSHPQLGHEKAAVTIVRGGQQVNVIPDKCEALVDWRILPGRDAQQCRDELAKLLRSRLGDEIKVKLLNQYRPMQTDGTNRLIAALLNAADKAAQIRQTTIATGATDASAFTKLAIPTPVFGPGNTAQAHTQDEYIETTQLEKSLAVYTAFLEADWGI